MAELVDATGLGPVGRKPLEVRVLSPALLAFRLLVALAVSASLVGAAGAVATTGGRPLLALSGGQLGRPSRLVALDPRTLDVRRRGASLPGWAFGFEYAWSPDRATLALVPRPDGAARRLFLLDAARMRVRVSIDLPQPPCALAWPIFAAIARASIVS